MGCSTAREGAVVEGCGRSNPQGGGGGGGLSNPLLQRLGRAGAGGGTVGKESSVGERSNDRCRYRQNLLKTTGEATCLGSH